MQIWTQQLVQMPIGYSEIIDWWQKELAQLPKKTRRTKAAFMVRGTFGKREIDVFLSTRITSRCNARNQDRSSNKNISMWRATVTLVIYVNFPV